MMLYRVLDKHIVGTVKNTVFRRHSCEWILPQEVAVKVPYNRNHLPVVILHTYTFSDIRGTYVQIYEYSRFDLEPYAVTFNKLVFTRYK